MIDDNDKILDMIDSLSRNNNDDKYLKISEHLIFKIEDFSKEDKIKYLINVLDLVYENGYFDGRDGT